MSIDAYRIVQFYPKQVRDKLLELEVTVCVNDNKDLSEVKKVLFGCRPRDVGEGFEYHIKEIQYRPKPD